MSEKEIELWEKSQKRPLKARFAWRHAAQFAGRPYDAVDGMNITQIGIETSKDYREHGKLF